MIPNMHSEPVIGIICEQSTSVLAGRVRAAGYKAIRLSPEQLTPDELPEVDAWVVDCPDNSLVAEAMAWIETRVLALSNRPDLSDLAEYRNWCDRIIRTLDKWNANFWQNTGEQSGSTSQAFADVEAVWILAGSAGGVPAVSEFLAALTHVPRVAFIYAQHIEADQQELLEAIGHVNRDLPCALAVGRHWLNPGRVLIAPATCQLRFSNWGEVFSTREPWETRETPHINHVMMAMSGLQPAPGGAIIFSGTGRDGCDGMRALQAVGTRVWAQDPETAVAPSMPQSVIDAELASRTGSPQELAAAFLELYPTAVTS
jgi:chemotaxis response regulator CheB